MTGKIESPVVDGSRQCTKCDFVKLLGEFYRKTQQSRCVRSSSVASLFMAECKNCFRKRIKDLRAKRRLAA